MAIGPYERLLTWSNANAKLEVARVTHASGHEWTISTSITIPVTFSASGRGPTIDDAAAQVIEQLETVGVVIPA